MEPLDRDTAKKLFDHYRKQEGMSNAYRTQTGSLRVIRWH